MYICQYEHLLISTYIHRYFYQCVPSFHYSYLVLANTETTTRLSLQIIKITLYRYILAGFEQDLEGCEETMPDAIAYTNHNLFD